MRELSSAVSKASVSFIGVGALLVNRAAARFILRSRGAGSKGRVADLH